MKKLLRYQKRALESTYIRTYVGPMYVLYVLTYVHTTSIIRLHLYVFLLFLAAATGE